MQSAVHVHVCGWAALLITVMYMALFTNSVSEWQRQLRRVITCMVVGVWGNIRQHCCCDYVLLFIFLQKIYWVSFIKNIYCYFLASDTPQNWQSAHILKTCYFLPRFWHILVINKCNEHFQYSKGLALQLYFTPIWWVGGWS